MPGSWGYFKDDIKTYLTNEFPKNSTILDVGCGQGDYADLLCDYFGKFDAVEIWEPYIEQFNLKEKYNNVFNVDILNFEFIYYDIIIMGDILEHLKREDAIKLINNLKDKCNELLIVVPFYLPQDTVNDNIYERHLQEDLDDVIMRENYPSLELLSYNNKDYKLKIDVGDKVYYYSTFVKKKEYNENVIITMTTVPNRLIGDSLMFVINKLLNLTYKNYEIHFNIPYINKTTNEEYVIPEWLSSLNSEKLKIFRTDDYGPITKILPTIKRINNPNQLIITVDDDLEYMDGFIEYHLRKRKIYDDCAIGFAGIGSLDNTCHFCTTVKKDIRVKILEGYKTVSYRRKFFNDDFEEFVKHGWSDDILLSAYMSKNDIKKYVVNYYGDNDYNSRVESFPCVRIMPNPVGGCYLFRKENVDDKSNEFDKIGYLRK